MYVTKWPNKEYNVCFPGKELTIYFSFGNYVLHLRYWI